MDERTEMRLYKTGIKEELRYMKRTMEEMKDNPDSPLKRAAQNYLDELQKEYDRLYEMENDLAIQAMKGLW